MELDLFAKNFDKKTADITLNVSIDKKIYLQACDTLSENRVLLKCFRNNAEYSRFLLEAVILRMSVHNKDIKKVRETYKKLCNFIREKRKSSI